MTTLDQARAVAQRLREIHLQGPADTIDALVAEVEQLRRELADQDPYIDKLHAKNAALQKVVDEFSYSLVAAANKKLRVEVNELRSELDRLTTSESNLAAHVGALARTNGRKDATLLNVLEFCEFLWRDVTLNDYAQEKLDATIAAITKEIK